MSIKVVPGGVIEKDGKFLLVQENKKICQGKWNLPAGGLDDEESVIDGAIREIYEETGCKVEITGVLEIINMKDELRADGYFLSAIQKKMENKIQSLDLVKVTNKK